MEHVVSIVVWLFGIGRNHEDRTNARLGSRSGSGVVRFFGNLEPFLNIDGEVALRLQVLQHHVSAKMQVLITTVGQGSLAQTKSSFLVPSDARQLPVGLILEIVLSPKKLITSGSLLGLLKFPLFEPVANPGLELVLVGGVVVVHR